ncbi:MAG: hypothetical protein AAFQ61_02530 [Cyanobacteria bacterium J06626_23]
MQLEFVALSVEIPGDPVSLRDAIAVALTAQGEPLRWAIVAVQGSMAQVEAVVIQGDR